MKNSNDHEIQFLQESIQILFLVDPMEKMLRLKILQIFPKRFQTFMSGKPISNTASRDTDESELGYNSPARSFG